MKDLRPDAGSAVRWIYDRAAVLGFDDYRKVHNEVPGASYQRIVNYFQRISLSPEAVPLLAGPLRITDAERLLLYDLIAADRSERRASDDATPPTP